jgi:transposase InsO family protein
VLGEGNVGERDLRADLALGDLAQLVVGDPLIAPSACAHTRARQATHPVELADVQRVLDARVRHLWPPGKRGTGGRRRLGGAAAACGGEGVVRRLLQAHISARHWRRPAARLTSSSSSRPRLAPAPAAGAALAAPCSCFTAGAGGRNGAAAASGAPAAPLSEAARSSSSASEARRSAE